MANCEYCGQQIKAGDAYCPHCGGPIPAELQQQASQTESAAAQPAENMGDHTLILVSRGECSAAEAKSALKKTLGYTQAQAKELLDCLPAAAAHNLTYQQASYAAKALAESGMEVSICNSNGYITFDSEEESSVFDKDGSLLETAAKVLMTLGALHKLTTFRKWGRPNYEQYVFHPFGYSGRRPGGGRRPGPPPPPPMPHDHYPYGGRPSYGNYGGRPSGIFSGGRPGTTVNVFPPQHDEPERKRKNFIPGFGPGPTPGSRPGRTHVSVKPPESDGRKKKR